MYQLLKQIVVTGIKTEAPPQPDEALRVTADRLRAEVLEIFAGALTIRHVDAGSCNGCALETGAGNRIRRLHPHDPSWQNWPLLERAVLGNIVPDFPLINKSFNLSYSGHDL